jgi:hypothetical protein
MCKPWFKVYRELDHHDIMKDHVTLAVFMHVLCNVDDDGCMTTGRNKAAEHLGISPSTFRYILYEKLCKWGMIELKLDDTRRYTHIRVTNWHKYQDLYAERSLEQKQNYPQAFDTKDEKLSTIFLTQESSLKNEESLTQREESLTQVLTQKSEVTLTQGDSLKKDISLTQVSEKSLTQKVDTLSEDIYIENNNIYTEDEKTKRQSGKRSSKKDRSEIVDKLRLWLEHFNRSKGGRPYTAIEPLLSNFEYWLGIYDFEYMLMAADKAGIHPFWKKIITPMILLRRKNENGESVDRISQIADYASEENKQTTITDAMIEQEKAEQKKILDDILKKRGGQYAATY